jgi:hypothetical protein
LSFLIQKSPDRRSFASFPELIAGYHVFRRLSMPRHPPCTLSSLTTFIDHRPPPGQGGGRTNDRRRVRSIIDGLLTCSSPHPITGTARYREGRLAPVSYAKKVLDDLPAKTEKTVACRGGFKPAARRNTSRKIAVYRGLPAGGYRPQASQNLLLNLYSLVKEHSKQTAPKRLGLEMSMTGLWPIMPF